MEIVKKCFICYDKNGDSHYWNEVYANTANQAKAIHVQSSFDNATYITTVCRRWKEMDDVLVDGQTMSRRCAEEHLATKRWRAEIDTLAAEKPNEKCLIYSGQWGAWWRSGKCGYTEKREEAGIYTVSEAYDAVCHCGIGKQISLQLI